MKVVVNASSLSAIRTGIGAYTFNLLNALTAMPGLEVHWFDRFGRWNKMPTHQASAGVVSWLKRFVPVLYRYRIRSTVTAFRIAPIIERLGIDLYHETNYIPVIAPCPTVINVHDLSFVRYAQFHMPHIVRLLNLHLPGAVERSTAVIVPSEFIKREVIGCYSVDAGKVHVTPYAVSSEFHPRPLEEVLPVLQRQGLKPGRYILAVGTLEPRKNLTQALRAFQRLPASLRGRYPLVLAGMKGWESQDFWRQLDSMRNSGQVRMLGYVPNDELPLVYSAAALFVYPSVYEGFGLPPLEAMASGIAVITSDRASLPEVVGDVGVQVAPEDPAALAEAMRWLLEDREEAARRGQRGVDRARQFSWQHCAELTLAVYRQALNGSRSA